MKYYEYIRDARIEQGLTQSELAERACLSEKTISKLENGANITTNKLLAVIFTLNLSQIDFDEDIKEHNRKDNHNSEDEGDE